MKPRHIAIAMLGFIAACVFTEPAIGGERSQLILVAGGGALDAIELYDEAGPLCASSHMKRAVYRYRLKGPPSQLAGTIVEGCYVVQDHFVVLFFSDGDSGRVDARAFRKPGPEI